MPRILVVEDNEMSREILVRRLGRRGFEILTAADGQEALDKVNAERPDLVIMDMTLPVLDGWDTTRRLRADEQSRNLPIIGLSAHALEAERQRALEAGCNDYDTKPVDLERLIAKIDAVLGNHRTGENR